MDCNSCGGIDLHIHTTASDGTLTPSEIIEVASRMGLEAIAITDHDTLEGTRQALECAIPPHLRFITGIEISAAAPAESSLRGGLHILGYGIDPDDEPLRKILEKFKAIRANRTVRILERLDELGIHLTMEQVAAEVGEAMAGRPHVARAMIRAGLAENINDAFDRYLGDDAPGYVGKERISCREAFELIQGAGGIPVLAHPYLVPCRDDAAFESLVAQLVDMGLKGMEVHYPQHTAEDTARYLEVARRFNLAVTGGTDFHGEVTPDIRLGCGKGDFKVPYTLFEELVASQSLKNIR